MVVTDVSDVVVTVTVVVVVVEEVTVVVVLVHGRLHRFGQSFCVLTLSNPSVANMIAPNNGSAQSEHAKEGFSSHCALTMITTTILPNFNSGESCASGATGFAPVYPTVVE